KDQFSLFKNKNRQKKTVKQLKLRVGLIVFQYLRLSFFPRHFSYFLSFFFLSLESLFNNSSGSLCFGVFFGSGTVAKRSSIFCKLLGLSKVNPIKHLPFVFSIILKFQFK